MKKKYRKIILKPQENRRHQVEEPESYECANLVNSPTFLLIAYKAGRNI